MVRISREIGLDYGHTLPNHFSFCNQLHGHRARVIAVVEGEVNATEGSSSQGMVFDFKILKELMTTEIHDVLDHGFAVWSRDEKDRDFVTARNKKYIITPEPPTAEYLAKWAFYQLEKKLPKELTLVEVKWYETPGAEATYSSKLVNEYLAQQSKKLSEPAYPR